MPVLLMDSQDVTVAPDFSLSHIVRAGFSSDNCFLLLPLLDALRRVDKALGNPLTPDPDATDAENLRRKQSDSPANQDDASLRLTQLVERIYSMITHKGESG